MIDYKSTINLPKTEFPMRGNLVKSEPRILNIWYEKDLYGIIRKAKKGKKIFFLHDGPPYANGSIHIGHSVNKIIKDIIIKSKGLMGYDSHYIPGWDCHGLPIELKVEKMIGKPVDKVCSKKFRNICRKYAEEQVAMQKKDFIRLGVLGDWKKSYLTMDFIVEANIIRTLSKIIENGHLYKGTKPVHWCIDCCSAIADSEIEFYDIISSSIYVNFIAVDTDSVAVKFGLKNINKSIGIIIWTTNPWTIPANRAISVNPDLCYQLVEANGLLIILAKELIENIMKKVGISYWKVLGSTKGSNMELLLFNHPFMNFNVPIILSKHVNLEVGTGAVHIAPGHGPEDYILGKKYNLEIANIVGKDGCYIKCDLPLLNGLKVLNANNIVIDLLINKCMLFNIEKFKHSYPHCWRHKTPLIFRSTPQWFISMDKSCLRKKLLKEINNVTWIPYCSKENIEKMVYNRSDWCISRQRNWGVPMSLFVHNETGELHPNTLYLMEEVAKKVEKKGIQAWWDLNIEEYLGSDATIYHKVLDTLDVWFDSGSTHTAVVAVAKQYEEKSKLDMYLEGSDQHRGWFMSSLIISTAINGKAPYDKVLTHGFIVDGNGRKMSKSLGNVISSQKIIEKLGSDIFRIWVASSNYTDDMTISDEIIKGSIESYRRIRNTARFLLANMNGFIPKLHSVSKEKMIVLDRWAVGITKIAQEEIIYAYKSYNFHNVIKRIMRFCSVEMGSFYLEIIKDRKYTTKAESIAHRSCQTAIYHISMALVRWIAPIISFTANEIWEFIPSKSADYVFTEEWYNDLFFLDDTHTMNNKYWNDLFNIRSEVNKVIENARKEKYICSSLEANIFLYAEHGIAENLRKLGNELCFALLTSDAVVENYENYFFKKNNYVFTSDKIKGLKIVLEKAKGKKCPRCWHYKKDIGNLADYPELCGRCIINVVGLGEERKFV